MNTNKELMQQALELEALIDAARLLGVTQARQGFGCYTQEDARFEQAMHEAVQKHRNSLRERLARDEKRQYDADHVVLEKGTNDFVCTHCGQRYHIHMPVPMNIMTAIVDAFLEAHHQCEKPEAA